MAGYFRRTGRLCRTAERDDDRQHRGASAPRGERRKRGERGQAIGRSRGGRTTKIHILIDQAGRPLAFRLTGGNIADITVAAPLLESAAASAWLIADKGYDADHLCDKIAESGAQPVIPPKRNRTFKRPYDAELYKERNIIERFFNKLKQFRRVATRYDKLLANFMGFVKLAAIAIWFK